MRRPLLRQTRARPRGASPSLIALQNERSDRLDPDRLKRGRRKDALRKTDPVRPHYPSNRRDYLSGLRELTRRSRPPFLEGGLPAESSLKEILYPASEPADESLAVGPFSPFLVGDRTRSLKVLTKNLLHLPGNLRAVERQVEFVVEGEGAVVEVGASDRPEDTVGDHCLGMHEGRLKFVNLDPPLQKPPIAVPAELIEQAHIV